MDLDDANREKMREEGLANLQRLEAWMSFDCMALRAIVLTHPDPDVQEQGSAVLDQHEKRVKTTMHVLRMVIAPPREPSAEERARS